MSLNAGVLERAMPGLSPQLAQKYVGLLRKAMLERDITTEKRAAAFGSTPLTSLSPTMLKGSYYVILDAPVMMTSSPAVPRMSGPAPTMVASLPWQVSPPAAAGPVVRSAPAMSVEATTVAEWWSTVPP